MLNLIDYFLGQCLHFYYHMFGVGTGDLNVVLLSADGSSGKRVWGESGDRGNKWKKGKVTIAFHTSFRVKQTRRSMVI